jgi:hypothetical protein
VSPPLGGHAGKRGATIRDCFSTLWGPESVESIGIEDNNHSTQIQCNTELVLAKTTGPLLARMDFDKIGAVANESKHTSPAIPTLPLPADVADASQVRVALRMVQGIGISVVRPSCAW